MQVLASQLPFPANGNVNWPLPSFSRSTRCNPIRLLVTTFNNSNNLLELSFHAYKMNPDPNPNPNPNRDNPNNLLDIIILLQRYNVRIECVIILAAQLHKIGGHVHYSIIVIAVAVRTEGSNLVGVPVCKRTDMS